MYSPEQSAKQASTVIKRPQRQNHTLHVKQPSCLFLWGRHVSVCAPQHRTKRLCVFACVSVRPCVCVWRSTQLTLALSLPLMSRMPLLAWTLAWEEVKQHTDAHRHTQITNQNKCCIDIQFWFHVTSRNALIPVAKTRRQKAGCESLTH